MLKSKITFIVILMVFFITLSLVGCKEEEEASYLTIIRISPNGTTEQWITESNRATWRNDGSITFKPTSLSHEIRITGCLTVFSTKIVVDQTTDEEVKKSDSKNGEN